MYSGLYTSGGLNRTLSEAKGYEAAGALNEPTLKPSGIPGMTGGTTLLAALGKEWKEMLVKYVSVGRSY